MHSIGVNSLILVGLERVPKFEDAVMLEFGRGFRYTRPLRINVMDLDYELMEELVSTNDSDFLVRPFGDQFFLEFTFVFFCCVGQHC